MPDDDTGTTSRLRELHDSYVWDVNSAVAEGREDLVPSLAEDHMEEALRLLTDVGAGCDQPGCAACARIPAAGRAPWWRRLFR